MRAKTIAAIKKATISPTRAKPLALPKSSRTTIGVASTLDDADAAFNPLCACPIQNASRLAAQARSRLTS